MAYYNGGYQPAYAPNPGFQQGYPQQMYSQQRMDYLQSMQQPQQTQQLGDLQARIVTSREEAVAAQVLPNGVPFVFYCPTRQEVYMKRIDPQTNMAEFADFGRIQPQQAVPLQQMQFVPLDRFEALENRMKNLEEMLTAPQPTSRRQKGADAE